MIRLERIQWPRWCHEFLQLLQIVEQAIVLMDQKSDRRSHPYQHIDGAISNPEELGDIA
jgi:hypothetical protein